MKIHELLGSDKFHRNRKRKILFNSITFPRATNRFDKILTIGF